MGCVGHIFASFGIMVIWLMSMIMIMGRVLDKFGDMSAILLRSFGFIFFLRLENILCAEM
jgi:hypothetical protein